MMFVLRATYDDLAAKQARTDAALLVERSLRIAADETVVVERARADSAEALLHEMLRATLRSAARPATAATPAREPDALTERVKQACVTLAYGDKAQASRNLIAAREWALQGMAEGELLVRLKLGEGRAAADA